MNKPNYTLINELSLVLYDRIMESFRSKFDTVIFNGDEIPIENAISELRNNILQLKMNISEEVSNLDWSGLKQECLLYSIRMSNKTLNNAEQAGSFEMKLINGQNLYGPTDEYIEQDWQEQTAYASMDSDIDCIINNLPVVDENYLGGYYKDYNTKSETNKITNRAYELLSLDDSLDKLSALIDIKKELREFRNLSKLFEEVDAERERLHERHTLGILPKFIENKSAEIFKTKLSDKERSELCDDIIANNGSRTVKKGEDNRLFVEALEKHRPTLMYLLGGNYPEKIESMKVVVIANLYALLKEKTDVDGEGKNANKKVVPEFMKRFCIEHFRNSSGGRIKAIK